MNCSVENCRVQAYCRGWCKRHYNRVWRRGSPLAGDRLFEFEERIERIPFVSCWIWSGALYASGYGRFRDKQRSLRAHRQAYEFYVGPIPAGMQVLHRCDVPSCVNPDHLWLGTHLDNMRDMEAKGRAKWIQENMKRKSA